MDLSPALLVIACAASLPSAGLMLWKTADGTSEIEMTLGATVVIICLGLMVANASMGWWAVAVIAAFRAAKLILQREVRWPLLTLGTAAFVLYMVRVELV
jgi:hypothetical protein